MNFPTPAGYDDHYDDDNRPPGTLAQFVINGNLQNCFWNGERKRWFQGSPSSPSVNITPASPPVTFSTPTSDSALLTTSLSPTYGFAASAPRSPAQFPNRDRVAVSGQISARKLLDYDIPNIQVPQRDDVQASTSSQSNFYYAIISKLIQWELPPNLGNYCTLPEVPRYNPPDPDQALGRVDVEQDAIWIFRYYITTPVGNVLSNVFPRHHIQCKSESSNVGQAFIEGAWKKVITRVDLCWQLTTSGQTYTFAVMEFKRPGCIKDIEWGPALRGQPLIESAKVICQQLVKYAHTYTITKIGVCDLRTMMLLELQGDRSKWVGNYQDGTYVEASYRKISDLHEMKRNLYLFLFEAATDLLAKVSGGIQ